jgi:hypothetical protein
MMLEGFWLLGITPALLRFLIHFRAGVLGSAAHLSNTEYLLSHRQQTQVPCHANPNVTTS